MLINILMILIPTILSVIILFTISLMTKKTLMDREKISPFECGFDPQKSNRLPFSIHFFFITIIFLVFDVEIVLLLPSIITFSLSSPLIWSLTTILFLLILILGLFYEWKQNALQWTI